MFELLLAKKTKISIIRKKIIFFKKKKRFCWYSAMNNYKRFKNYKEKGMK